MDYNEREVLLHEYEQVLLGNKTAVSSYYFKFGENPAETYALMIIKFAVESYLGWDPFTFRDFYSKEISEQLKLEPLMKYIEYPPELDKTVDYFYLSAMIYPEVISFSPDTLILKTYKNILEGKLKKFPKEYLAGSRGMMRAGICLQYMLNNFLSFSTTKDIYEFFSKPEGLKKLKEYRLAPICAEMFDYPIDYLHESLPEDQKDEFYYHYYKFRMINSNFVHKQYKDKCRQIKSEKENLKEMIED